MGYRIQLGLGDLKLLCCRGCSWDLLGLVGHWWKPGVGAQVAERVLLGPVAGVRLCVLRRAILIHVIEEFTSIRRYSSPSTA